MPPHKVLHLITSLDRGGAQTMLTRLVSRLDRARFAPMVVSLIDSGAQADALRAEGIPMATLGMRRGVPSLAAVARLRRLLRAERPALIQSWLYHADLLALIAAGPVPVAWNIRLSSIEGERKRLQLRLMRSILAACSRRPACVMVNSEAGRRTHEALGYRPHRWEIVANGFDVHRFRPDPLRRRDLRQRLGIEEARPLIGMVARVDGMKDHATFLEAAVEIAARRPDARFVLIGAGTETLPVPPRLGPVLQALGECSDIHELLPALDIMVLSSHGEGFPNVVGEAMSCGVPCVASDVGDAAAIIGETGSVVPPRDAQALADAVLALLARGPEALARLGAAARERIIAHYLIAAAVRRYEAIYVSLVATEFERPA